MDFPFEISLGFDSVAIKQKKNKCASRLDVNIETEVIKGIVRPVPLIASNMSTVTNPFFCVDLWDHGALGVMHRADSNESLIACAEYISQYCDTVCMSVGIGDGQFELATDLIKNGANVIFIDVAHGYSDAVIDLGRKIKSYAREVKVVVGNTTNIDMLNEVADYADAVKVGIGQGCFTEETMIISQSGLKPINRIKINDLVRTHRNRFRRVISTTQRKETHKIVCVNGNKSTKNHEYYVLHKKYSKIVNDDNLNEYAEWIPAEDLTKDYLLIKLKD